MFNDKFQRNDNGLRDITLIAVLVGLAMLFALVSTGAL